MEGIILLWVEHFEQRRRGVAVQSVLRYLVYLVENKHGIGRACFLYALDDAAGHGANIGSAVSANFRFVVQSAQRHAHILTIHGRGDALSKTGFAHSGRSVKANDGRFKVAAKLQHGQMLQDTVLHLFHSIVVVVQNLLGTLDAEVVFGVFVPRQAHHCLQISELYAVIGTLRIKCIKLI